jgi:hypothetical protein
MSQPRQPMSYLLVGTQHTGKTYFVTKLVKKTNKNVLVILPHLYEPKYNDYKLITIDEIGKYKRSKILFDVNNKQFYKIIYNRFLNGTIIFDDTKFCIKTWLYADIESLIGTNRQTNVDVFLMYHSFNRVPDFFWTYIKRLILFKTLFISDDKLNRQRQLYVNELAKKNQYAFVVFDLDE